MNQSQLISHISAFHTPIKVRQMRSELREGNFSLRELVDLTFYADKAVAAKAAQIMQFIMTRFPQNYLDDISYLTDQINDVKDPGCLKHYARVMARITSPEMPKEVRNQMKEINLEHIVELCFKWLNDKTMLTVVRASAADALFNMRHRYPWVAEALSNSLEKSINTAAPMLKSKAGYVLSFLHCED